MVDQQPECQDVLHGQYKTKTLYHGIKRIKIYVDLLYCIETSLSLYYNYILHDIIRIFIVRKLAPPVIIALKKHNNNIFHYY